MADTVHIPVSAVVPTKDRPGALSRTLGSLSVQGVRPAELIVVDGSQDAATRELILQIAAQWAPDCVVTWVAATQLGAATQRNQGMALANQPFIWFFDDDILFEPECVRRLWSAMQSDASLGGVNAMITNQRYQSPGAVSRIVFTLLHGQREKTFAGLVLGPAVNLLPEDREDLPAVVPVEWMNTTCTMYRREALPSPVFDSEFTGYSMMEDLTLSLRVGWKWKLANARTARIFHDSQAGEHKADIRSMAKMELVNRHYIMKEILQRGRVADYLRLFLWECFQLIACAVRTQSRRTLPSTCRGKLDAWRELHRNGSNSGKI